MAKLDELYDWKEASDLFMDIHNEGETLYEDEYGFESEKGAFDKTGEHFPAYVLLNKYKGKYYVYIDYVENEYIEYPDVFDELEPAYELFKSLVHTGIPSGKKQIENCKNMVTEENALIDIECESAGQDPILFRVKYGNCLLIEHICKVLYICVTL